MLLLGQTRDDAEGNGDRLSDQEGKESGSNADSTAHKPADGEHDDLNAHTNPAYPDASFVVDSRHRAVSWTWTQAAGDVQSRSESNHSYSDE